MRKYTLAFTTILCACGPASSGSGDGVDAATIDAPIDNGGSQLRGTVWLPGNAPGDVEPGYEIPVPGALVYLTTTLPPPIPQRAHCEECVDTPGSSTFTDAKGTFLLGNILPGDYLLVVQKGQFRREVPIQVSGEVVELAASETTLPHTHDPENGQWIPKMALATGVWDEHEDILGKLGIGGTVSAFGRFVPSAGSGLPDTQLHFYSNGGRTDMNMSGTLTDLVSDLDKLLQYHIIFIPCSSTANTAALNSQQNLRNIRDYVAAGGKLYVADFSGEWADNVFPEQVELGGNVDTPAAAYNAASDSWNTDLFGDADNYNYYNSHNAEAVDEVAYDWLDGQVAPQPGDGPGPVNAAEFKINENYNTIEGLVPVLVGTDDEGLPVYDSPKTIVIGGRNGSAPLPKKPLTVSYQPTGCGRVIFTTYHTAAAAGGGAKRLYPQERLLTYLIMEIGECVDDIIVD